MKLYSLLLLKQMSETGSSFAVLYSAFLLSAEILSRKLDLKMYIFFLLVTILWTTQWKQLYFCVLHSVRAFTQKSVVGTTWLELTTLSHKVWKNWVTFYPVLPLTGKKVGFQSFKLSKDWWEINTRLFLSASVQIIPGVNWNIPRQQLHNPRMFSIKAKSSLALRPSIVHWVGCIC